MYLAESEHHQALMVTKKRFSKPLAMCPTRLLVYEKLYEVRTRQQDTVADLQETVRISTLRYKGGTTTYLEVLDGQSSLYIAARAICVLLTRLAALFSDFRVTCRSICS